MNPHISLPRQHGGTPNFGSTQPSVRAEGVRMPRFFKRLFKFPQMDFEMAIWEMTSLLIAPKKVFRSIYYHKRTPVRLQAPQTKNTWHRPDPSFTYLLSFFLLLTSLAWAVAYTRLGFGSVVRVTLVFVFGHFLAASLLVSTAAYFLVGRLLGPGVAGLPGRRRQGLFGQTSGEADQLEFGYCFDVAIRAFFPVWVFLYVLQFVLMPLVSRDYWISLLLGNALYLAALSYYTIITFLGYNALPFLHHTELLLSPLFPLAALFIASLFGFNLPKHVAPVLLTGADLRGWLAGATGPPPVPP
ncbi:MAG: hypothetical protein M1832_005585 [Thelocarpon impressellum]|nr:MAG: hypothetical protein M1832_005585 [Thelocarpon impressellum]